jgi:hypothetical protein
MKTPLKKHEQLASKSERTKNTDEGETERATPCCDFFLSFYHRRKKKEKATRTAQDKSS